MEGLGFGFRVQGLGLGLWFWVEGLGFWFRVKLRGMAWIARMPNGAAGGCWRLRVSD